MKIFWIFSHSSISIALLSQDCVAILDGPNVVHKYFGTDCSQLKEDFALGNFKSFTNNFYKFELKIEYNPLLCINYFILKTAKMTSQKMSKLCKQIAIKFQKSLFYNLDLKP